jgi:hypothetical protein
VGKQEIREEEGVMVDMQDTNFKEN